MGKNSLTKSTAKKKGTNQKKKEGAATKKTAKAAPKKSKSPAVNPTSDSTENTRKKLSLKELLFKKFNWTASEPPKIAPVPEKKPQADPPPFVSAKDPNEVERIRKLLFNAYNMREIKAAAKPPVIAEATEIPQPAGVPKQETVSKEATEPPTRQKEDSEPVEQGETDSTARIEYLSPEPPDSEADPVQRTITYIIAGAVVLVFLLIGASWKNSTRFYIEPKESSVEIWRGRFSPTGQRLMMTLGDVQYSQPVQEVYTRQEVYPLIFNYYLNKADALLEVSAFPDYENIKTYLNQAKQFAVSPEMNTAVRMRLNNIERMTLLYKVDVAISQGAPEALENATTLLKKAEPLAGDAVQAELIIRKKEEVTQKQAAFESQPE
jgi:colicin import membrane protein